MKHRKDKHPPDNRLALASERFNALDKADLIHLADDLLSGDSSVVSTCIEFIEAETKELWHGRARAKMCRRLKHLQLTSSQSERLVACITERLRSGHFAEQFRDQLRLALHLHSERVFAVARECVHDSRPYIRRYAHWLLRHLP